MSANTLFSMLQGGGKAEDRFYGVSVGIVTNNQDPDGLGRVKPKLPWLSDQDESYWAKIVTPMAGNDRGIFFLPEVDDEVLVAFEHGAVDRPYVLGGVWNSQEKPPESNTDGKNNHRTIKSRSGHIIRLNDKAGDEQIEIVDMTGKDKIVIRAKDNAIAVEAESDITIRSRTGKVILEGVQIEILATGTLKAEAQGNAEVSSSAQLTLRGSLVNIN